MFGLDIEKILIIVVIAFLLFGGKRLTDFAKSAGRFTGEFKRGKMEIERELESTKKEFASASKKSKK